MSNQLPIDSLKTRFMDWWVGPLSLSHLQQGRESRLRSQWCLEKGKVLVVELGASPAVLATRICQLKGDTPEAIGYRVRDDDKTTSETQLVFATPGIVLKMCGTDPTLNQFDTIVLMNFMNERWTSFTPRSVRDEPNSLAGCYVGDPGWR